MTRSFRPEVTAFSLAELLLVLAVVFVLLALWLPAWKAHPPRRPTRLVCVHNLKQIGVGFRMWAEDHGGRFPMSVSTNQGGTEEWVERGAAAAHFKPILDYVRIPRVFVCPLYKERTVATAWESSAQPGIGVS